MDIKTVKIIKSDNKQLWYYNMIGETIEVYKQKGIFYLTVDSRYIFQTHVVEIKRKEKLKRIIDVTKNKMHTNII